MHTRAFPVGTDGALAALAAALVGGGSMFLLAGLQSHSGTWLLGGAAAALAGVGVLAWAGWTDPILPILWAAPLPALADTGGVRVAAVAPVAAVLVAACLLRWGVRGDRWRIAGLPVRTGLALLVWWLFAAVLSAHPVTAARETANLLILAGVLVVAVDHFRRRAASMDAAIDALVVAAAACGVLAVCEAVGVLPGEFPRTGTRFYRAALGFGQPNGLGLFLAVTTPLAALRAGARAHGPAIWFWRVALAAVLLGLGATFSRGSWFSVAAAIPVLFLAGERRAAVRLTLGAILAVVVFDVVSGGMIRDTVTRTIGDWIIEQRAALMLAGVNMFLDHPLVGVGPGGYEHALETYAAALPQLVEDLPTPHNAYVQMAAETGAPGLLAFLGLLGTVVWHARASLRRRLSDAARARAVAVLWSVIVVVWAGMFVWPLSHGAGEAVTIVMALALAGPGHGEAE